MKMKKILFAICILLIAFSLSLFVCAAEITSANDMLTLMNTPSMWADSYTLTQSIDLSKATNGLPQAPIGNTDKQFTGSFNGGGHTVSGLDLTGYSTDYVALFGYVANATIENLTVSGKVSTTGSYVSGIVGRAYKNGVVIKNCINLCTVTGSEDVGGIIGRLEPGSLDATVFGCKNEGTVSGTTQVGGIIGLSSQSNGTTTVEKCYNKGTVNGEASVGGIVGYWRVFSGSQNKCSVKDCMNTGAIHASVKCVGGIMGQGNAQNYSYTVTRCFNSGSVTCNVAAYVRPIAGVIAAKAYSGMTYCYYTSTDTYTADLAGGETYVSDATVAESLSGLGASFVVIDGHTPELVLFHKHDESGEYTPAGNVHRLLCYCGETLKTAEHTFDNGVCTVCGAEKSDCAHENKYTVTETAASCLSKGTAYEYCPDCDSRLADISLPTDADNHTGNALTMGYADGAIVFTCGGCGRAAYTDSTFPDNIYVSENGIELSGNITAIGTAAAPFKSFSDAMQYAAYCGKDVKVTIKDKAYVDTDYETPAFSHTITVTGGTLVPKNRFNMNGSLVFEHITVSPSAALVMAAKENKLVMGEGITIIGSVYLVGGYENRLHAGLVPKSGYSADITVRSGTYHSIGGGNRFLTNEYSGEIKVTVGKTNPSDVLKVTEALTPMSLNEDGAATAKVTLIIDGEIDSLRWLYPVAHSPRMAADDVKVELVVKGSAVSGPTEIYLRGTGYTLNVYADSRVIGADTLAEKIASEDSVQPYSRYCKKVNGEHPNSDGDNICDNCGAVISCEHKSGEWRVTSEASCIATAQYTWYCYDCVDLVDTVTKAGDTLDGTNHTSKDYIWQYDALGKKYYYTCTACKNNVEQGIAPTVYVSQHSGNDADSGIAAASAVATLEEAVMRISQTGGTVMICGIYSVNGTLTLPKHSSEITISGAKSEDGYANGGFKASANCVITLGGDTRFDKIRFEGAYRYVIECGWNNAWFGEITAIGNSYTYVVLGRYLSTESDTVAREATLTVSSAVKAGRTLGGSLSTVRFYSQVYLGDVLGADGITVSNKKATLNATDAEIGVLYTVSTSSSYTVCNTEGCEATVNLYGRASVNQGRTADANASRATSTSAISKQTLNFFDNSYFDTDYIIKNAENTVITVSSEKDGRTVPMPHPFNFCSFGSFAADKTPINVTVNCSTHSFAPCVDSFCVFTDAAEEQKVYAEKCDDECVFDRITVTKAATPALSGTRLYSCFCGKSYTEEYAYDCTEATHIGLAKSDGTLVCTACGEAFEVASCDTVFALSPATTKTRTASVALTLKASSLAAGRVKIITPEGFTLEGVALPEVEGIYVSASGGELTLLSTAGEGVAVDTAITLTYSIDSTVALGDYAVGLELIEAYGENRESLTVTTVGATVTVAAGEVVQGDINGDGSVTVQDALLVIKAMLNKKMNAAADISGDGKLSIVDVLLIMKKVCEN